MTRIGNMLLNRVTQLIANYLNRILLGDFVANALQKTIRSIVESYRDLEENIVEIKKIRDSDIIHYHFPSDYPLYFRREKTFSERHIFYLKNVYLSTASGVVWTHDYKLLQESSGSLRKMFVWNDVRLYLNLPHKKINSEGKHVYFLPFNQFYHFLLEEIPALLYAYEAYPDLHIIIQDKEFPNYFLECIQLIFGDNYAQRVITCTNNVFIDRLILVQKEEYSGFVYPNDIQIMNKYVHPDYNNTDTLHIYISRRSAKNRSLENESELEEKLKQLGLKIVTLEKMILYEQINLIANAEVIIAPHGAGLSHIIWGNKQKKLIEIFPSHTNNDCYARIAVQKSMDYKFVICDHKDGKEYIPIESVIDKYLNRVI